MYGHKIAVVLGTIAFAAAAAAPAAATTYTMTDLGSLGGGVSLGFAINSGGEIVGRSYLNKVFAVPCGIHTCHFTQNDPFSWINGTMTDLGTFNKLSVSEANAVNTAGDIVGGSGGEAFLVHGGKNAKLIDLGPGTATGINDFGEIVANSQQGFLISGGKTTTLAGFSPSAINNNHQIAGDISVNGYAHAAIWQNGQITDLGTLGGTQSAAYAINNLGQVTGWAHTASEATHVFLWSNGKMTDLGAPFLDPVGEAINNHTVIVGHGAFIWSNGTFQNLNNLIPPGSGFTLDDATAINDNGQIAANGYNAQGQEHAFLLSPS